MASRLGLFLVLTLVGCAPNDGEEIQAELHQLRLEVEYLRAQVSALQSSRPAPTPTEAMRWATHDCGRHGTSNCHGVTARLLPVFRGNDPTGIKVMAVQDDGLWHSCGVRSGDTVVEADSHPIQGLNDALAVLEACAANKGLRVRRSGRLMTISQRQPQGPAQD